MGKAEVSSRRPSNWLPGGSSPAVSLATPSTACSAPAMSVPQSKTRSSWVPPRVVIERMVCRPGTVVMAFSSGLVTVVTVCSTGRLPARAMSVMRWKATSGKIDTGMSPAGDGAGGGEQRGEAEDRRAVATDELAEGHDASSRRPADLRRHRGAVGQTVLSGNQHQLAGGQAVDDLDLLGAAQAECAPGAGGRRRRRRPSPCRAPRPSSASSAARGTSSASACSATVMSALDGGVQQGRLRWRRRGRCAPARSGSAG